MSLYDRLKKYRLDRDLPWFEKPWDLNLLIVRSPTVGEWDDEVVICCTDDAGRRVIHRATATGDAWGGEWTKPSHPDGCVYVLDQHVPGGLEYGKHKNRLALRQRKPFRCVRWKPDGTIPTVAQLERRARKHAFTDIRGTHLHNRHNGKAPRKPQTNDSEGCTVTLYYHQHMGIIELVRQQERFRGSLIVSPTYLKRADLPR